MTITNLSKHGRKKGQNKGRRNPRFVVAFSNFAASAVKVNIIRNILPIVTFVLEKIFFNSPRVVRPGHILSMVLTLFGTTLYGLSNFSVTTRSLIFILLGCSTARPLINFLMFRFVCSRARVLCVNGF